MPTRIQLADGGQVDVTDSVQNVTSAVNRARNEGQTFVTFDNHNIPGNQISIKANDVEQIYGVETT